MNITNKKHIQLFNQFRERLYSKIESYEDSEHDHEIENSATPSISESDNENVINNINSCLQTPTVTSINTSNLKQNYSNSNTPIHRTYTSSFITITNSNTNIDTP
eukprot:853968_1